MESELVPRVSIPVVVVKRHELHVIVAVLALAILGCVCVLGYSFRNFATLRGNAEEGRTYIAFHTNSSDPLGSGNPRTNNLSRSAARPDAIDAPLPDFRRG
ncbi:hypothetical protein HPB51_028619 [Rhipicephalus microplus]|uniref:Uncharacterized protein n=1 Tax=Rhipicephalus microplus TaxID=6941 RepID=A0A9J6CWE6_RHIMP|nr:hypothetical protein HPB51_028619 [Rhipicephalus microplus]